jgi:hypothetical protein
MLSAQRSMIAASPFQWTRHIEGHQDDDTAQLDFKAKYSNGTPKVFWMQQSHHAPVQYPIANEGFKFGSGP